MLFQRDLRPSVLALSLTFRVCVCCVPSLVCISMSARVRKVLILSSCAFGDYGNSVWCAGLGCGGGGKGPLQAEIWATLCHDSLGGFPGLGVLRFFHTHPCVNEYRGLRMSVELSRERRRSRRLRPLFFLVGGGGDERARFFQKAEPPVTRTLPPEWIEVLPHRPMLHRDGLITAVFVPGTI